MRYLVLAMMLVACGSSGEDESEFTCERSDRSGTYLLSYSERPNGTCGDIPDQVSRLDPDADLGFGCSLDAPDSWSADECRLDRSVTCCDGGYCTSVVGYTEQQDAEGGRISGVMTFQVQEIGASGAVLDGCTSTYDVAAERQ